MKECQLQVEYSMVHVVVYLTLTPLNQLQRTGGIMGFHYGTSHLQRRLPTYNVILISLGANPLLAVEHHNIIILYNILCPS